MRLVRVSPPATEPLALEEVQLYRRADAGVEATLLPGLIQAARELVEEDTRRSLITQTWELRLDRFPCGVIRLARPPVQSIEWVKYIASDGVETSLPLTEYVLDPGDFPGSVRLAYGRSWPTTREEPGAVRVRFVAGYGGAADVPHLAKAAMQLLIGTLYEQREGIIAGTTVADNPAVDRLLAPLRIREAY